jgi:hypothetical protein
VVRPAVEATTSRRLANPLHTMVARATPTPPPVPVAPVPRRRVVRPPARTLDRDEAPAERNVMATSIFVAGSGRLAPGRRYGLALQADRFLILGPTDTDPSAVVMDRPASAIEVRTIGGRLIISEPRGGPGSVLAFMSVADQTVVQLDTMIKEAASWSAP